MAGSYFLTFFLTTFNAKYFFISSIGSNFALQLGNSRLYYC